MSLLQNIANNGKFTDQTTLLSVLVAIILGLIIALVHTKTTKYTKNLTITLAILPVLVQIVIMLVNGNLGTSVAILGAFGLIRFRSLPGNSREIVNVFFAMVVGLALGTGYIYLAIFLTLIVCLLLIIFSKSNLGDIDSSERNLKIMLAEDQDYTEVFNDIFAKYTNKVELLKVKTVNMGSIFQIDYQLKLKKDINEKEFLDELRVKNGNLKIILSRQTTEEEL